MPFFRDESGHYKGVPWHPKKSGFGPSIKTKEKGGTVQEGDSVTRVSWINELNPSPSPTVSSTFPSFYKIVIFLY